MEKKQFRVAYCGYYGMVFDTREKAAACVAKLTTVGLSTPEGLKPLALHDIEIIEENTPIKMELACPRCSFTETEGFGHPLQIMNTRGDTSATV